MSDRDATDAEATDAVTGNTTAGPGAILKRLVEEAVSADLVALHGPVTLVERGDDPSPAARVLDQVGGGESIVGVVPRIEPSLARGLAGSVDSEVRLVLTGSAGERLTGTSGAPARAALANHGIEAYIHDGDSPVGVLLVGNHALVGLFDDDGLAAVLSSDSPLVREWVTATCQRYFAAADQV